MATDIYHSALAYFIANQDELCEKYSGKELLMTADSVAGAYDSAEEAFLEGKRRFGSGNFALQTCLPGEEAYSVSISPFLVEF
jgi:hypothetical protein